MPSPSLFIIHLWAHKFIYIIWSIRLVPDLVGRIKWLYVWTHTHLFLLLNLLRLNVLLNFSIIFSFFLWIEVDQWLEKALRFHMIHMWWYRFYMSHIFEIRNWYFDFDEIVDQEHLNAWRTIEGTHFDLKLDLRFVNFVFMVRWL